MTKQELEAQLRLSIRLATDCLAELAALDAPDAAPSPARPEPIWLGVREFAERRDVSVSTVRKWLALGMPGARRGRVVRVRVAEADAWLDAGAERVRTPVLVSARSGR